MLVVHDAKVLVTQTRRFNLPNTTWEIQKLQVAACKVYNSNMGSIDVCDQLLDSSSSEEDLNDGSLVFTVTVLILWLLMLTIFINWIVKKRTSNNASFRVQREYCQQLD